MIIDKDYNHDNKTALLGATVHQDWYLFADFL